MRFPTPRGGAPRFHSFVLGLLVAAAPPLVAQTAPGMTLTPSVPAFPFGPFGQPALATVGQTFTAPSGATALTGFTFFLANDPDDGDNGGNLRFQAYVMAWNGTQATGSVLFQSAVQAGNGGADFKGYSYNFGAVPLSPGMSYVAFLSASGLTPAESGGSAVQHLNLTNDPYAGGSLVFLANGDDTGAWTRGPWTTADGFDAAFSARFASSTVPEPSSLALIGTGLLALIPSLRHGRRR